MEKMKIKNLTISFPSVDALKNISMHIESNEILSIIGPASSGKTSFLKTLNRLIDIEGNVKVTGNVYLDGKDIYKEYDPAFLRKKVGKIFALPVPLPMSVFENVAYGPRRQGIRNIPSRGPRKCSAAARQNSLCHKI